MRGLRTVALALFVASAAGTGPTPARAQSASVGPQVQVYTFDDANVAGMKRFQLMTLPWAVSVAVNPRVTVSLNGAWADGRASGLEGRRAMLAGWTDTDLAVRAALGDWLVVGADATLSTGQSSLSLEEAVVAGFVAADLLPFPINTWGSAPSYGGTVAMARQVGAWGLGLAGSYRAATAFDPIPGAPLSYNPGNQLQARVALDRDIAGTSTLSLLLGYQYFTDDALQSTNLFKAGSRLQTTVSFAFPLALRSSALVYAGLSHRSRGTLLLDESILAGAGDSPSQQLIVTGTNFRFPVGRKAAVLPRGELRVFRAEDGASQGWVAALGTSLDMRLYGNTTRGRLVVSPSAGLLTGNVIVEEGSEAGFFGWQAGFVVRVDGAR